jgi:hypothetical protein
VLLRIESILPEFEVGVKKYPRCFWPSAQKNFLFKTALEDKKKLVSPVWPYL